MNDYNARKIAQMQRLERGKQIIAGKVDRADNAYRRDGYVNLLNKYGTAQDNTTAYFFEGEPTVPDMDLARHYEGEGLFAKIIDTPAEEAVKHGFELGINNPDIESFITDSLDELDWEEKAATAIKWARLYGGSLIVMLVDDGRGLEQPLDWKNIRSIDELRVYERAVVQPDYTNIYNYDPKDPARRTTSKFGMPEYYHVFSAYGTFTVHESRCLIFRNGILPEYITQSYYRFWGIPEYIRIKRALRETITAHGDAVKLLERSVQAIYKMKNLAQLLATSDGEDQVLKRLQVIDMARGILNSISIDAEGEDYSFQTFQLSGVKDVIDSTCNMLSALTSIPQTILFGRSPAGQNSTGESDLENYYNYVERIQKLMLRGNLKTLIDVILQAGLASGKIPEIPDYKLKFSPLWSMSDTEQATVKNTNAQTSQIKAQTAQMYVDMGALDPSEVRRGLADSGEFIIEDLLDDQDVEEEDWGLTDRVPPDAIAKEMEQGETTDVAWQETLLVPPDPSSGIMEQKMDDNEWITMKGTHVYVGEEGKISKGPPNLQGAKHKPSKQGSKENTNQGSKGGNQGNKQSNAQSNVGTENRIKERYIKYQQFLAHGKMYTIEEAKSSGKDGVKSMVAKELGATKAERDKAAREGTLNELIDQKAQKASENEMKKIQKTKETISSSEKKSEYSQIADMHTEDDEKFKQLTNKPVLSTGEYYELVHKKAQSLSEDDIALEVAYMRGGYGVKAETLNEKLYKGQQDKLTQTEKEIVDMVSKGATTMEKDICVYRGVGKSYLESLTGMKSSDDGFADAISGLVGKEITNDALTSTAPALAHFFRNSNVVCAITVPKGQKAYFTQNVKEGEILLPSKTKTVIKSVKSEAPPYAEWDNVKFEGNRPVEVGYGTIVRDNDYIREIRSKQIYVELEVTGIGD